MIPKITYAEKKDTKPVADAIHQVTAADLNQIKTSINEIISQIEVTTIPEVIDNLTTEDPKKALSAKQGVELLKKLFNINIRQVVGLYDELRSIESLVQQSISYYALLWCQKVTDTKGMQANTISRDIILSINQDSKLLLLSKKKSRFHVDYRGCLLKVYATRNGNILDFILRVEDIEVEGDTYIAYKLSDHPSAANVLSNNAQYRFNFWRQTI